MKAKILIVILFSFLSNYIFAQQGSRNPPKAAPGQFIDNPKRVLKSKEADTTVELGGKIMYPSKSIFKNLYGSAYHTTFLEVITLAGLKDTLDVMGPITVFAPNNAAFTVESEAIINILTKNPENAEAIKILKNHIVKGIIKSKDLKPGKTLTTLSGAKLKISMLDGMLMINDAELITSNILSKNGIIQAINGVLISR